MLFIENTKFHLFDYAYSINAKTINLINILIYG